MSTTLLFPAGMPESLSHLRELEAQGQKVIGASSLTNDPAHSLYPIWTFLPYITDPNFERDFIALVAKHTIDIVFTRHPIIPRFLEEIIAKHSLPVRLDSAGFAATTIEQQQMIFSRVDEALKTPLALGIANAKPSLTRMEMAAMMLHTLRIDGQSSDEKIFALMEIFRSCPRGDIVEIGSFWGRSASLLTLLSHHFDIGSVVCVDPWENMAAHQAEVSEHVNDEARAIDFNAAFQGFLLNTLPYSRGRLNYIRSGSHEGSLAYKPAMRITSEAFGSTNYTGHIACLHIDGNHGLAHITQDIRDWVPHVMPAGWIIIDDYQWAFGNGPQVATDLWLSENEARITCAFATGSALFIKLKS